MLVIDDEAPIRLLCRVNLEAEGMEVDEAPDGHERASSWPGRSAPDAILLDVMMPGLDGWAVAEELLRDERTSSIPIIFLTARADLRDRAKGLDLGGLDYITKPFNPVELASLVRDVLAAVERGERETAPRRPRRRAARALRARLGLSARGLRDPDGDEDEEAARRSAGRSAPPRARRTRRARRAPARASRSRSPAWRGSSGAP